MSENTGRREKPQKAHRAAWAPYNFVPLNDVVVEADYLPEQEVPSFDKYNAEYLTGEIKYELEVITPLHIGRGDTGEESKFFAPGGRVRIPGSTLRGMVRTLVEVVTWGKFSSFTDRRLYYRDVADSRSSLGRHYKRWMGRGVKAGYFRKEGGRYCIVPAREENGRTFHRTEDYDLDCEFSYEPGEKYRVYSGYIKGKEAVWVINPPDDSRKRIYLTEEDLALYKADTNRYKVGEDQEQNDTKEARNNADQRKKRDGNLLRMLDESEEGMVPCFYVENWVDSELNQRIVFGHTRYFRLPYQRTIGEHVPENLKEDKLDLAEAIFGKQGAFASRVYFEDAELLGGSKEVHEWVELNQRLDAPKPTCFQHYLRQPHGIKTLKHWDSAPEKAPIRGYKFYWHREFQDSDPQEEPVKKLQAVPRGAKFVGRIRFVNLTRIEVGALLFVLQLPQNCYHKLGMGKPMGLGTVKITPGLIVSNRQERYSKLFRDCMWETGAESQLVNPYFEEFENYMLKTLQRLGSRDAGAESLWDTKRLKDLQTMLDWNHTDLPIWHEATRYMEVDKKISGERITEYKDRPVLPEPVEVVKLQKQRSQNTKRSN